jgi:hypothetical protein
MKNDTLLTVTSLLAIVLMTLHLTDDVVRGFEPGGLNNLTGIAILVVWLVGTLLLVGRRSGYVILFLGSLLAAGMPVIHMWGKGVGGEMAGSPGGYFFIWTLFALGVIGTFSLILSVRGLWGLRRRQPRRVTESQGVACPETPRASAQDR